jgi:hypothetical protein
MKKLTIAMLAASLLGAAPVRAAPPTPLTGNDLFGDCMANTDTAEYLSCVAFVSGFRNAVDVFGRNSVCIPPTVVNFQVVDLLKIELARAPTVRHNPVADLVGSILMGAWPCPQK